MIPFIELHISNVHAREEFRHKSYLSDKAKAVVCGLGVAGYGQYQNRPAVQSFVVQLKPDRDLLLALCSLEPDKQTTA